MKSVMTLYLSSNPGFFWFTAVGGSFFQRHKNFRAASLFGLRMEKMAHIIKLILCVFGALFYSSGYTAPEMHHQQANITQTTRAGAWPVWLIWKVPAALLRSRRAPKMLVVGAGNELASKQFFHAPHTHTPLSVRSPAQ
jgi:hypothetical protein